MSRGGSVLTILSWGEKSSYGPDDAVDVNVAEP